MGKTLGGYCFYNETFDKEIEAARFIYNGNITSSTLGTDSANILEINSKTGLYPLYVAYSIYRTKSKDMEDSASFEQKLKLWEETVSDNIYVICKTEMSKKITKRTLSWF